MLSAAGRFARYYIDREPVVALSVAIGAVAVALPLTVVPLRRSMGLPTDQYDGPIVPEEFKKSRGYLAEQQ